MQRDNIRNVAIIAHVDHGKTTIVDQLLRQSGQFRDGELAGECILDSNPLERERGITILAKNCAINYTCRNGESYHINIVDTPGHADFSGEVERVLKMADGVLLLVDAAEGVMPQTRYVLSKALEVGLRPIVVINKMDRPDERAAKVHEEVFDLLVELGADDHALDFPTLYASGKDGWAVCEVDHAFPGAGQDIHELFDAIIEHVPVPDLDGEAPLQALITTLDYSEYVGRIGIGRVFAGRLRPGPVAIIARDGETSRQTIAELMVFDGLGRRKVDSVSVGDLCAIVGLDTVDIGETIADIDNPVALPSVAVDEPTLHMTFRINDGPFSGRDGTFVTNRQLRDRLNRELQSNVALDVDDRGDEFVVSGRGLLHLGILLENMRREGYELCVGKPEVIYHRDEDGKRTEPIENLIIDIPTDCVGSAMSLLGDRKADMQHMDTRGRRTVLEFLIPARGLIGLRSRLLTATAGEAIMHHRFDHYGAERGPIGGRLNGAMIATETGQVTAYALEQLADRGVMFVTPGDAVYEGQVVGEHCKDSDIPVNVVKGKKLTNIRSSTKEATVTLKAPRQLTLEGALEYIEPDELVELTPSAVRIRKRHLKEADRKRASRKPATVEA
ncbi:MAG: translational GTPase TypA [Planctomycetes bacterium]|jgi:GTP-binding protein|nr:translational GTPase TypA [Phycisphaerae bacterium]NBB95910.1 translational GTPase TypA [Planctomycetota bacterium]